MKRIQLFEFEDLHWLPAFIRSSITNLIVVFHRMMGTSEVVAGLIQRVRQQHDFKQITDLGSGSGGAMPKVLEQLNRASKGGSLKLLLSDLYPNQQIVQHFNQQNNPHLSYHPTAVDATQMGKTPNGLKTMVGSFHHLPPPAAQQMLQSAQANDEPILIYELAQNNIPTLLWWLLLPLSLTILVLMCLVMTLFVRPLTFKQVIFTYLIPIIPLIYAWDGQASLVRTYTFADIEELIGERKENYNWVIEDAIKANGKKAGYFIMGYPST